MSIQELLSKASLETLQSLSSPSSLESGGKQGQARITGAMNALMTGFESLGDVKTVVDAAHGYLHSKFLTAFASEYNIVDAGDQARLSYKSFADAAHVALKIKEMSIKRDSDLRLRYELQQREHQIAQEMETRAHQMAEEMAMQIAQQLLEQRMMEMRDEDMDL